MSRSQRSPSDDGPLIDALLDGDEAALRDLMDRYDGLIRYTVFRAAKARCIQDPQWLDAVASSTWEGFVGSMRRSRLPRPRSLIAYLIQIARNRTVSALRSDPPPLEPLDGYLEELTTERSADLQEPAEIVERLQYLQNLQNCLKTLNPADSAITSQLIAITERRWRDAAEALRLPESTVRSRWKLILQQLRDCMHQKPDEVSRRTPRNATITRAATPSNPEAEGHE